MNSMGTAGDRAASLKHAARRSHFVARIEKYEAKVRQEQKARAMLRDPRSVVAHHKMTIVEQRTAFAEQKASVEGKVIVPEQKRAPPVQKGCEQEESGDSPEQKTIPEQREICSKEQKPFQPRLLRAFSEGHKPAWKSNGYAGDVSLDLACKPYVAEAKPSVGHAPTATDVKLSAKLELNVAAAAAALKIRIKAVDMAASMQEHAFRCARETVDSLEKLHCKRIAYALKKEFDKAYGPAWHCIVGTSFGSYVTHSLGGFLYFSIDKVSVLLFKTTVEPIEQ